MGHPHEHVHHDPQTTEAPVVSETITEETVAPTDELDGLLLDQKFTGDPWAGQDVVQDPEAVSDDDAPGAS